MSSPASRDSLPFLQLLPNLVTIIGLCAGLTGMRFAFAGQFQLATALVVFAALIDGLDGLIARRFNAQSQFGAELDSLSDFFNFGVAPALIVYQLCLAETADVSWSAALIFAVCACLRLARFNVNRDAPVVGHAHFTGVPAPAGAMLGMLPAFLTFAGVFDASDYPWLVAPWLTFVGFLMICRLRTFAPKSLRFSRAGARALLVGVALVVGLTFSRFWLLLVVVDLAYVGTLVYALVSTRRAGA